MSVLGDMGGGVGNTVALLSWPPDVLAVGHDAKVAAVLDYADVATPVTLVGYFIRHTSDVGVGWMMITINHGGEREVRFQTTEYAAVRQLHKEAVQECDRVAHAKRLARSSGPVMIFEDESTGGDDGTQE